MRFQEDFRPLKNFNNLIVEVIHKLMDELKLEDFEPNKTTAINNLDGIVEKFKKTLKGVTYWDVTHVQPYKLTIAFKPHCLASLNIIFESDKIKIINPAPEHEGFALEYKKIWLSLEELEKSLIDSLIKSIKIAHDIK